MKRCIAVFSQRERLAPRGLPRRSLRDAKSERGLAIAFSVSPQELRSNFVRQDMAVNTHGLIPQQDR
jgi:hypothetical protein